MNIRRAEPKDLTKIQQCNLHNLPENYHMRYWAYSFITWPEISYLAEDSSGRVVGYVLSSMWVKVARMNSGLIQSLPREPDDEFPWLQVGHVNSLSVLRTYRRLGLAKRLMLLSKKAMMESYDIEYVQLHVRKSNRAAFSLYRDKLGFQIHRKETGYYNDGEDAYSMRIVLKPRIPIDLVADSRHLYMVGDGQSGTGL
ncbi:acyl-CoA N-acyltransferase [Suillus bovinus]|uniref:acyl-CoA N-acyltransferase n=1 Tax=Suillus bovinus TaxID=48563 RepID=UPI001B8806B6|nr:acyl-CoA N-acyltransferase [Suillus bovinus]KAG2156957.1 acyl-CoA N-acyltransferase [Suillus bovinus]